MIKKKKSLKYYEAIGRRKSSSARVRLYLATGGETEILGLKVKKGEVIVNGRDIKQYFPFFIHQLRFLKPLELTNSSDRFAVYVKVKGGGLESQIDAMTLGMARALVKVNADYRPLLKKNGLLTRDPRVRERRKVGTGGKARRKKQSPKR